MNNSHPSHNKTCRRSFNTLSSAQLGFMRFLPKLSLNLLALLFCSAASAGSIMNFLNPFSAHNPVDAPSAETTLKSAVPMNRDPSVDLFYNSYNNTRAMDNETMENAAAALYKDGPVSSSQNEINHQWLDYNPDQDTPEGHKALTRFAQGIFKTYWQSLKETRYKNNTLVPDSNGTWDNDQGIDYNVRLNEEEVKLRLTYDF